MTECWAGFATAVNYIINATYNTGCIKKTEQT